MTDPSLNPLIEALVAGETTAAVASVRELLAEGAAPERIVLEAIVPAMDRLDDKCTVEAFNLLEIMLVGRAVTSVMRELYPPGRRPPSNGRRIVLASLSGDVHDLGKNILRTILSARGYEVVDCGKDCPVEDLVDAAAGSSAEAVCISGLVTTVIPQVRRVREALAGRGLGEVRVLAGGAALQQATAESLNADMLARTAFDGARYLDAGEAGEDAA